MTRLLRRSCRVLIRVGLAKFNPLLPSPSCLAIECVDSIRTLRPIRDRARHHSSRRSAAVCCRRSVGAGTDGVFQDGAGATSAGDLEAGVALGVRPAVFRTPSASTAAFGFRAVRVGRTHLSRTGFTAAQDSSLLCHCRSTHFIRSHTSTAPLPLQASGRRTWASIIGSPCGAFQPNKNV